MAAANIPTMSKFELQMSILKRQQNIIMLRLDMLKDEMENVDDQQLIDKLYKEVCTLDDLSKELKDVADSLWERERRSMDVLVQLLVNESEKHKKIVEEKQTLLADFNKNVNEFLNEELDEEEKDFIPL
jgi:hypothetical protein